MGYIIDFGEDKTGIYGVRFDGTQSQGKRLLDAKGKRFTPSTTTSAGIDDFVSEKRSPFHVRECVTKYNSSSGKQEVIAYKGDSNWSSAVSDSNHNVMIEFPKFYYRRPSKYEFYVSSYQHDGFSPSPMHYRNGTIHDYVYVSKYMINTNFLSQSGTAKYYNTNNATDITWGRLSDVRNNVRPKGMHCVDFVTHCMISILAYIKYGHTNIMNVFGTSYNYFNASGIPHLATINNGGTDSILGMDGSLNTAFNTSNTTNQEKVFGIENYTFYIDHDGIFRNDNNGDVYISTNIEAGIDIRNLTTQGIKVSTKTVYDTNTWCIQSTVKEYSYDTTYPWMLFVVSDDNKVYRTLSNPSLTLDRTKIHSPWYSIAAYYNYESSMFRASIIHKTWFPTNTANYACFRSISLS